MGVPVALGWAAGDTSAGLVATIGAFTSLYGSDRPYLNRSILLAAVALSFAIVVSLGMLAQQLGVMAMSVVVPIAVISTYVCNALRVGPPGAYMFTMACAVGTAMPRGHLDVWQVALLILAGGAFSWFVQMAGMLFQPRGPEKVALLGAAAAVARFAKAVGTPQEDTARHTAAVALHEAWTALLTLQPTIWRPDEPLNRLRALNRDLHLAFVEAIDAGHQSSRIDAVAERARLVGVDSTLSQQTTDPHDIPLAPHGIRGSLHENLNWASPAVWAAIRVGVASTIACVIGASLDLERAYWIVAAAVLVVYQGLDWIGTLQRAIERVIGTLAGLGLAGLILIAGPHGLWLAAILTILQFAIETLIVRSYALAVVFITAAALTVATGGHGVPDVAHLLWVRGVDTALGCVVGLCVHMLSAPRVVAVPIPQEIINTLAAIETVLAFIAEAKITTAPARKARRDLQQGAIALMKAYELGAGATSSDRCFAEQLWPAVIATQRLAYRVLATCWSLEEAGTGKALEMANGLLGRTGFAATKQALTKIAAAVRDGIKPAHYSTLPPFLAADIQDLSESLVVSDRLENVCVRR
jgi:hypothetical protein